MNKRIRKKQIRRTLIALVTAYEEWERQQEALNRRIAHNFIQCMELSRRRWEV